MTPPSYRSFLISASRFHVVASHVGGRHRLSNFVKLMLRLLDR